MRVSLAAVGQWIRSLGRVDAGVVFGEGRPLPPRSMEDPEVASLAVEVKWTGKLLKLTGTSETEFARGSGIGTVKILSMMWQDVKNHVIRTEDEN